MPVANSTSVLDPARQHESRAYEVTTALIVAPIFATVFTVLRIYTRLLLVKKRFWEDFTIVVALACSVAMSVLNQLAVVYGAGRHIETISPTDLIDFLKVGIAITQMYSLSHYFLKLSILLQYVRVSVMLSERRLCQALIAVLSTGYLIFFVLRFVRCIPFEAQWTPRMPGATCHFNNTWFLFASQSWNMIMDFVIFLVPLSILRHSRASLLKRVLFGVVLGFGGLACVISALRLQTLYPSATSADPSWDKIPSAIYGLVEVNVGISCASVVTLRPLYHRIRQSLPNKRAPPQQAGDLPRFFGQGQDPGDDLVFMTGDTTQVGSAPDPDVELGAMARDHSDSSIAESKMRPNVEDPGPASPAPNCGGNRDAC